MKIVVLEVGDMLRRRAPRQQDSYLFASPFHPQVQGMELWL